MLTITEIISLCRKLNIRPHRRKGQNFLIDPEPLEVMISVAEVSAGDTVLEIGSGFGALTEKLLECAGKVVAVENDPRLVKYLREKFAKEISVGRLELVEGDIREIPNSPATAGSRSWRDKLQISNKSSRFAKRIEDHRFCSAESGQNLPPQRDPAHCGTNSNYKIVSNIPYSITSEILTTFLDPQKCVAPARIVLMMQKEVVERITAAPPKMSRIAVFVQFHADAAIVAAVPKTSFWPAPRVDSAIVHILPRKTDTTEWRRIEKFVSVGFSAPRKMLYRQIQPLIAPYDAQKMLKECGISPSARPGDLSVDDWRALASRAL